MSNTSFVECINQIQLNDKTKKNRSKILPLVQVLKYAVDTMKPDMTTKAIECVMDSETYQMRVLEKPCNPSKDVLHLDKSMTYCGTWKVNGSDVQYKITPKLLVKNLQSKYRDLSAFWFMNTANTEEIDRFISLHRYFTVVYLIEWETLEVVVVPEKELELPEVPAFSYASVLKGCVVSTKKDLVEDDICSKTTVCDTHSDSGSLTSCDTIPANYRGGKYNKTEFENVREYYQKWGQKRMFVMFGTRGEVFDRNDKTQIRNLMNSILRDAKYQEMIRDNEYYYIKVVKNFHYDSSKLLSTLHFNIVFKNEFRSSNVYHIYVDQERKKVTRASALFSDRFE